MKWYAYILIILAFCAGWLVKWYHSALACPLCLCKAGQYDDNYWKGWLAIIDRYALPAGLGLLAAAVVVVGLALWAAISLHRLARR